MGSVKKEKLVKSLALYTACVVILALAIVLPVLAQQQGSQQQVATQQAQQQMPREDGEMARGLPSPCKTAVYMQDGGYAVQEDKTYAAKQSGVVQSAVAVKNGGTLTLIRPKISKIGTHPGGPDYDGQGVEASGGSMIYIIDGDITTDERGANAIWATEGSTIYMRGGSITSKQSHCVDPVKRGTVILYDVKVYSGRGPCLANDAGDGNIIANRVTARLQQANGFYAIGSQTQFQLMNCDLQSEEGSGGAVSIGANVAVSDSVIKGSKVGVKISDGVFNMTGGSLIATAGNAIDMEGNPQFFVEEDTLNILTMDNNIAMPPLGRCDITLKGGVKVSASTGTLINVKAGTGTFALTSGVDIGGNVIVEEGILTLKLHKSTLTGMIQGAAMMMDSESKWNVTGDSVLTSLFLKEGISGDTIPNIIGNGHNVTYDKSLVENMSLGGRTYNLAKGGKLAPKEMPVFGQ